MKCPWETPFCSRFGIFLPFTITTIVFFVRPNVFSFVAPKCTTLCSFLAHVSTLVEKVFPRNSVHPIWPLSIIFIFNYWPIETKGCSIQSFFQISGRAHKNVTNWSQGTDMASTVLPERFASGDFSIWFRHFTRCALASK